MLLCTLLLSVASSVPTAAQDEHKVPLPEAISRGVERLLEMQEGEGGREWRYEGVYRVRESPADEKAIIPIGYRVGGTAIVATTLMTAPGYGEDLESQAAVERALDFVLESTEHPLMDPDYSGGYDVRGWGQGYALWFLCRMERFKLTPKKRRAEVKKAIGWYLDALEEIEIPELGGWSYSRGRNIEKPSPPSAFMTAPLCQALFEAEAIGERVDKKLIERALDALENGLVESGSVTYAIGRENKGDLVPGAVGRMLATETTLALGGRGSTARVRGALDAFFVHWRWLDERRAKDKTHLPPYSVAPYYFYYAHYFAALAIEMLPEPEREQYRERLRELLFQNRLEDGTWNDRVFPRTANYGTAMSVMALAMPQMPAPAPWAEGQKARKR